MKQLPVALRAFPLARRLPAWAAPVAGAVDGVKRNG